MYNTRLKLKSELGTTEDKKQRYFSKKIAIKGVRNKMRKRERNWTENNVLTFSFLMESPYCSS